MSGLAGGFLVMVGLIAAGGSIAYAITQHKSETRECFDMYVDYYLSPQPNPSEFMVNFTRDNAIKTCLHADQQK